MRQSFGEQNSESLETISAEIIAIGAEIRAKSETIKESELGTIRVGCHRSLLDGMKFLRKYLAALQDAITKEREERGDFSA